MKTGLSGSLEIRYRQDILKWIQNNHLASPLFSHEEIAVEPRFMPPPARVIPGEELPPDDSYSLTIPYLPDCPELAAEFDAPTLGLEEIMKGGVDLAFTGKPGIGKSFALNQLAIQLARKDPNLGKLAGKVPVMVHLGDLNFNKKKSSIINLLYEAIKDNFSSTVEAQLEGFIEKIFENNSAVLLLDGFDELPRDQFEQYLGYLIELKASYPGLLMVITASTDCMPHHEKLSFFPIAVAAFNPLRRREFIEKWGRLWDKHIANQSWAGQLPNPPDDVHVNGWLASDLSATNPFFLTLKVWAIFNGDLIGSSPSDALEAYIQRLTSEITNSRQALEQLAVQVSLSNNPFIERKQAGKYVSQFEDPSAPSDLDPVDGESDKILADAIDDEINLVDDELQELDDLEIPTFPKTNKKKDKPVSARTVRRMLPEMVKNQILSYRAATAISFSHSVIGGYLAGCGLSSMNGENELVSQDNWPGKRLPLSYLSGKKDVSGLINRIMAQSNGELLRDSLLIVGSWPGISRGKSAWRSRIMRQLASSVNDSNLPVSFRAQAVTALALSREAGVSTLFRKLMSAPQAELQMLAAFGAGLLKDIKALDPLNELQYGPYPSVRRAACLALVTIGSGESIEMAAAAMLHGEDDVRRAAAEALARHPSEGHAMLKEGAELEDLSVRRAVTFGLARINEPWARELLEKLQLEDEQWIVRTAAGQVIEAQGKYNQSIPTPLKELSETPWLITFASEHGMGLAPGEASWNMLVKAMREGDEDQKLAAMDIYRRNPHEASAVLPVIVEQLNGIDAEIREAAYHTLWQVSRFGVEI